MEVEAYLASITAAERQISLLSTPGAESYNNWPPSLPPSLHNVYNAVKTKRFDCIFFALLTFV